MLASVNIMYSNALAMRFVTNIDSFDSLSINFIKPNCKKNVMIIIHIPLIYCFIMLVIVVIKILAKKIFIYNAGFLVLFNIL